MNQETKRGGGCAPTPECSSTSRNNESGNSWGKGTQKIAYPQNAEAVEQLCRVKRQVQS